MSKHFTVVFTPRNKKIFWEHVDKGDIDAECQVGLMFQGGSTVFHRHSMSTTMSNFFGFTRNRITVTIWLTNDLNYSFLQATKVLEINLEKTTVSIIHKIHNLEDNGSLQTLTFYVKTN